jgi:hypothetical protein
VLKSQTLEYGYLIIVTHVNGDVKARINGAGFDPLIAAGASKIGHDSRASMRAWL